MNGAAFPLPIRAVAIDLDGTLLDTAADIAEAAQRMLGDLGMAPVDPAKIQSFIGNGIANLVKRALTGEMHGQPDEALQEYSCSENNVNSAHLGFGPGPIKPDGTRGYIEEAPLPPPIPKAKAPAPGR